MATDAAPTYPITCPACSKVGNATRPIPAGLKVRCKCGHSFVPIPVEDVQTFDFSSIELGPEEPAQASSPPPELVVEQEDEMVGAIEEEGPEISIGDLSAGLEEERSGVDLGTTMVDVLKVLNEIAAGLASRASSGDPREYKVVTQKDKWFSGKFDPEKVEGALNAYAKQGWSLKGVATAAVPGFGGPRDEIVIIMER